MRKQVGDKREQQRQDIEKRGWDGWKRADWEEEMTAIHKKCLCCLFLKCLLKPIYITAAELLEPFCCTAATLVVFGGVYGLEAALSFWETGTVARREMNVLLQRLSWLKCLGLRGQHGIDPWNKTLKFKVRNENHSWRILWTVNIIVVIDFTWRTTWLTPRLIILCVRKEKKPSGWLKAFVKASYVSV